MNHHGSQLETTDGDKLWTTSTYFAWYFDNHITNIGNLFTILSASFSLFSHAAEHYRANSLTFFTHSFGTLCRLWVSLYTAARLEPADERFVFRKTLTSMGIWNASVPILILIGVLTSKSWMFYSTASSHAIATWQPATTEIFRRWLQAGIGNSTSPLSLFLVVAPKLGLNDLWTEFSRPN